MRKWQREREKWGEGVDVVVGNRLRLEAQVKVGNIAAASTIII